MREFIDIVLMEEMNHTEARSVFARFGAFHVRGIGLDELKAAYKKLALANHPDRGGTDVNMSLINAAYQVLKTPEPAPVSAPAPTNNSDRGYWDRHPGEMAHREREAARKEAASKWNIRTA